MARHGARALTSKCGAVDILEAVGVDVECDGALGGAQHQPGRHRPLQRHEPGGPPRRTGPHPQPDPLRLHPQHRRVAGQPGPAHATACAGSTRRPDRSCRRGDAGDRLRAAHGRARLRRPPRAGMDELSVLGASLVTEITPTAVATPTPSSPRTSASVARLMPRIAPLDDLREEAVRFLQVVGGRGHGGLRRCRLPQRRRGAPRLRPGRWICTTALAQAREAGRLRRCPAQARGVGGRAGGRGRAASQAGEARLAALLDEAGLEQLTKCRWLAPLRSSPKSALGRVVCARAAAAVALTGCLSAAGKPVQGRRCPATVGADESRSVPLPQGGKARPVGRSASQDTWPGEHRDNASREGCGEDPDRSHSRHRRRAQRQEHLRRAACGATGRAARRPRHLPRHLRGLDDEMAARVAAHRAARPAAWTTVECPLERAGAPCASTPRATDVFLLDCVTFWVTNLLFARRRLRRQRAAGRGLQLRQGLAAAGRRGARRRGARRRGRRRPARGARRDRRHADRRLQRGRPRRRARVPARAPVPRPARLGQPAPGRAPPTTSTSSSPASRSTSRRLPLPARRSPRRSPTSDRSARPHHRRHRPARRRRHARRRGAAGAAHQAAEGARPPRDAVHPARRHQGQGRMPSSSTRPSP